MKRIRTDILRPLLDGLPASPRARWLALAGAALLFATCSLLGGLGGRHVADIRVAGRLQPIGTPVLRFDDAGGYDAYRSQPRLVDRPELDREPPYGARRDLPAALAARVAENGWSLADLQQVVHLFVLHFDACGTSRQCFKVLQLRDLSVHFLLDVDGTIYQTLDLQERAWHATIANNSSIGVEIAHPGCWGKPQDPKMMAWYGRDEQGYRLQLPEWMAESGIRTPGFVARPARPEPVSGLVHDKVYWQFDYTEEQYQALAQLCAAVHRALPRIRLDVPRNPDGSVRTTQLSPEELAAFDGIVGHCHVQDNKVDPGPALDWERVLRSARAIAGE